MSASTLKEILENAMTQATVGSGTLLSSVGMLAGYMQSGILYIGIFAGSVLSVFLAINAYQKIRISSIELSELRKKAKENQGDP